MARHAPLREPRSPKFQEHQEDPPDVRLRPRHQWRIKDGEVTLGGRTLLVGVLDLSPLPRDTGKVDRDAIMRAAEKLEQDGAGLVDVTVQREPFEGELIDSDSELKKLVPVLRRLRHNMGIPVCVTTCHAATAERVLELDVAVIHDFSGLALDPHLAPAVNQAGAGLILGHMRGKPDTWNKQSAMSSPTETVARELESSIARARAAGIDRRQIVIDPGLGLGKRGPENYLIVRQLERLFELGQPIQVTPSRQPFLVESVRSPESERLYSTLVLAAIVAWEGAHLLRVHEVAEAAQAMKLVDRMMDVG